MEIERWRQIFSASLVSQVDQMIADQRERIASLEEGSREHRFQVRVLEDLRQSLATIETTADPAELIEKLAEQMRSHTAQSIRLPNPE